MTVKLRRPRPWKRLPGRRQARRSARLWLNSQEARGIDEQSALEDALRCLLHSRPDLRLKVAIHHYKSGEISLARAAYLAGVSWQQMKELLVQHGILLRLGPESKEEAEEEVLSLRRHLQ